MKGKGQKRKLPANEMTAMLERYLEWMGMLNFSESTVRNHRVNIGYLILWCEERGVAKPAEVTKQVLDRYRGWLYHYRKKDGKPLSFGSHHVLLSPVRRFFRWLSKNNYILYNPASELELPRLGKQLPRDLLTVSDVETVLNAIDTSDLLGVRDRAIMETLYSTGMRRMELIGLMVSDIDRDRGTVMIRMGKGRKDRVVPIGERALAWIDKYLWDVRPRLTFGLDEGRLFLTGKGGPLQEKRLSELVSRHIDAAGIGKKGSCHLLRHTMATLMLENGADIRFIQQMLGHAELTSTQVYTQVSIRMLKEVHSRTHPGACLRKKDGQQPEGEAGAGLSYDGARQALLAALAHEASEEED